MSAMLRLTLCACLATLGLSACSPAIAPLPTATVTVSPQPSATVVWFPATNTPTPHPTVVVQPTADQRPAVGAVLFQDDFSNRKRWGTQNGASGNIAYGNGNLTVAATGVKTTLTSLRAETLITDFYLEIEVSPSLCRGIDSYGLLFRANTMFDSYRLVVSCQGQLRLEKLRAGQVTVLQPWTLSGQIPPGAPQSFRLGVWAVRNDLRLFVNDVYEFGVRDNSFRTGGMGVFARTSSDSAVTVSYSNLTVYTIDLERVPPTPTITPTPAPTARPSATPR